MSIIVTQVNIDDSSDKTITGTINFDRANGGTLIVPSGSSFPGSPASGEMFWRTDEYKLYRYNGLTWDAHATGTSGGGGTAQFMQFQFVGSMNSDQYLFSGIHSLSSLNRRSSSGNGYQYLDAAPMLAQFTGTLNSATAAIRGLACSTGSPASTVNLTLELWKVGFSGEGTKLSDLVFPISSSSYTIGTYWSASVSSNYTGTIAPSVGVSAGDLLAIKFNSSTGNGNIVAVENITVMLKIVSP